MSLVPEVAVPVGATASGSGNNLTSVASARTPASGPLPKLRSCVVCRSRKVRCDKQSPCSNCRRGNIACVFQSTDRPPRWARRLERLTTNATASNPAAPQNADPGVDKVMLRLRTLENLVKELSGQLEQAHAAAASSTAGSSPGVDSTRSTSQDIDAEQQRDTSPVTNSSSVQKQFGRLVLQDAGRSRYVGSGFWSRVNDELDGLKMDTKGLAGDESDSSEDGEASPGKSPPTQELERAPLEQHAFLFGLNLSTSAPDLREFHPLPSQIPFLLDVFQENVNIMVRIVHMPTINKMVRDWRRSDMTHLTPANEALMFSIYYAAITSMEEEDIMTNFGSSKSDLNLKYRLGLEHALAKADFLRAPDLVLIQAFAIFLLLVRRHDSPRFVWMMTGLIIRMAQYLGLQRDGSHFAKMLPFEIEMRRRAWYIVLMLDMRASEDQGTDLTVASSSFDTKIPLNINDADINPESKQMPTERVGVTDMSFYRIHVEIGIISKQMVDLGVPDGAAGLEEQSLLLNGIYQKAEQGYLMYSAEPGNIAYWVTVTIARLVMAKMTLIIYFPVLFSSRTEDFLDKIRTKLLVSAIEVAEYNHELNSEQACRQWRWIYQTYTHWYAIVYLMIEITRRPWSPTIERAWVALHSSWLIPAQAPMDKNSRIWVPLRKLMAKASKHRDAELKRLRADPHAAARLEMEDQKIPLPSSCGPFPPGSSVDIFRERWRQLVTVSEGSGDGTKTFGSSGAGLTGTPVSTNYTSSPTTRSFSAYNQGDLSSNMTYEPTNYNTSGQQASQTLESTNISDLGAAVMTNNTGEFALGETISPSYNSFPTVPADWSDGNTMGPGFVPWLWPDNDPSVDIFSNLDTEYMDVNMNLDSDMNWYEWIESAKGMELDAKPGGNGWV